VSSFSDKESVRIKITIDLPKNKRKPFSRLYCNGRCFSFRRVLLDDNHCKLESVRPNWRGEKPKPYYYSSLWQWRVLLRSRVIAFIALIIFTATAISLYIIPFDEDPEHDLVRATKEYNDYLASPEYKSLIYPDEDDRAHGKPAIIALVRNSEWKEMSQSMRELEETFNRKFNYPWIFFNDEPFDDKFKRITSSLTHAQTFYGDDRN
jgi:Glycolipid 2-alpha-mannosyltransferase